MKRVVILINWIVGVLFFLLGLLSLVEPTISTVLLFLISFLALPPIRNFLHKKTNIEIPSNIRFVLIFVLFIIFAFTTIEKRELNKDSEDSKTADSSLINVEVSDIPTEIELYIYNDFKEEEYNIKTNSPIYLSNSEGYDVEDSLERIAEKLIINRWEISRNELNEIRTKVFYWALEADFFEESKVSSEGIKTLINQRKKLDIYNNNYSENEIRRINEFKSKMLEKSIKEKESKELQQKRKEKLKSQFSEWDGSHFKLERYIKSLMNDPDSYEHVKTIYWDSGDKIIITTTFRGKNTFGGIVKNIIKAEVDINGNVIDIIEQY